MKNLNELAREVTLMEGGKVRISIAQVKEVLKIVGDLMRQDPDVVLLMLKKRG